MTADELVAVAEVKSETGRELLRNRLARVMPRTGAHEMTNRISSLGWRGDLFARYTCPSRQSDLSGLATEIAHAKLNVRCCATQCYKLINKCSRKLGWLGRQRGS